MIIPLELRVTLRLICRITMPLSFIRDALLKYKSLVKSFYKNNPEVFSRKTDKTTPICVYTSAK